jgi:hypothetical protein
MIQANAKFVAPFQQQYAMSHTPVGHTIRPSASYAGGADTLTTPEKVVPEPRTVSPNATRDGGQECDAHRSRWRLTSSHHLWVATKDQSEMIDTSRLCSDSQKRSM